MAIFFIVEDKLPFLEQPHVMPVPPARQVLPPDVLATYSAWVKASKEIAEQELLQTVSEFHACKQEEGRPVSSYILKMKSYMDNLECLGHAMTQNLATVIELHAMLKLHEQTLQKKDVAHALHAIIAGNVRKKNHKNKKPQLAARGNNHGKGKSKFAYAPKPKITPPLKKDNPVKDAICHQCDDVGIFTIELYTFPNNTWVYDTGCGTHICITTQCLRGCRKLKPRAFSLYVGDGHRATVEAIGSYHLCLPSGLHCRLGHISKKRIEKLQHDGILNSTENQYFDKYVSCMSGKMVRKPYTHQVERAKDLLSLIHTDVCGPFRTVSKQGASYFITFTDDFSRYGYVYLLKHKHEVFETLKVFQKEVENKLGKTIKSLHSNRGGEYMSQEFLDHLKEHGIIAHRTPPYTPQHNGDYALESAARILNMVPTKKVKKTPYEIGHGLMTQEASGSLEDLEIIQEEDMHPSVNTSLNHDKDDQEIDELQSDINPIHKSTRTRRAPDRMCLYIDDEEHKLGDHNEPTNYKAALLDPESEK
ncbi:retrotransposon protein, putative, ty1-copia subclass [Tanacetum coccineum]